MHQSNSRVTSAEGKLAQYDLAVTTAVAIDPDVAEAIVQTAELANGTPGAH